MTRKSSKSDVCVGCLVLFFKANGKRLPQRQLSSVSLGFQIT
jgi:hypothetical protein